MLFWGSIGINATSVHPFEDYLIIDDQETLSLIENNPAKLLEFFDTYDKIVIRVSNNNWISTVKLPVNPPEESIVRVTRNSDWNLRVSFEDVNTRFNWRASYRFLFQNGKWIQTFGFMRN